MTPKKTAERRRTARVGQESGEGEGAGVDTDGEGDGSELPQTQADHPALSPFWESRVRDDELWYRELVTVGKWLYAPYEETYFQSVLAPTEGGEVRLEAATRLDVSGRDPRPGRGPTDGESGATVVPDDRLHYATTICEIAGAVEAQDLIPVPQGVPLRDGDTVAIATPESIHHLPVAASGYAPDEMTPAQYELASLSPHAVYHTPRPDVVDAGERVEDETRPGFDSEDRSVATRYIPTSETSRWTFEVDTYRRWVEHHLPAGGTVINACAGRNRLHHDGEVIEVDIDQSNDPDVVCDVAELAAERPDLIGEVDGIAYDPPWSQYQSNLRYAGAHVYAKTPADGKTYTSADERPVQTEIDLERLPFEVVKDGQEQIGHAWLAKRNFHEFLRPGGVIIQLSQHGTLMPAEWEYERVSRTLFDPIGEAKTVIGAVDRATQQRLSSFF